MATTEEQEMASRLKALWLDGYCKVLVERAERVTAELADARRECAEEHARANRLSLDVDLTRARAETAENERGEARAQRDRVTQLLSDRATELRAATADRDRLAAEVERLKAEAHFWREKCQMQIEQAVPTPPADLDGYVSAYMDHAESLGTGIAAVLAARDAWWMAKLGCRCTDAWPTGHDPDCAAVKASAAPAPAQPASSTGRDWTCSDEGRANSSPMFEALTTRVADIITNSAFDLLGGRAREVAGLILAKLAHEHHFAPADTLSAYVDTARDNANALRELLGRVRGMVEARPVVHMANAGLRSSGFAGVTCLGDGSDGGPGESESADLVEVTCLVCLRGAVECNRVLMKARNAQPPTLHLTAEDRGRLWKLAVDEVYARDSAGGGSTAWAEVGVEVGYAIGVEAALAAVQSASETRWVVSECLDAARALVKVPAKEDTPQVTDDPLAPTPAPR